MIDECELNSKEDANEMNATEQLQPHFDRICIKEREAMKKLVAENLRSFSLQKSCDLKCDRCHPVMLIDCWLDNMTVNTLRGGNQ